MSLWKNIYPISPSSIQQLSLQNDGSQGHLMVYAKLELSHSLRKISMGCWCQYTQRQNQTLVVFLLRMPLNNSHVISQTRLNIVGLKKICGESVFPCGRRSWRDKGLAVDPPQHIVSAELIIKSSDDSFHVVLFSFRPFLPAVQVAFEPVGAFFYPRPPRKVHGKWPRPSMFLEGGRKWPEVGRSFFSPCRSFVLATRSRITGLFYWAASGYRLFLYWPASRCALGKEGVSPDPHSWAGVGKGAAKEWKFSVLIMVGEEHTKMAAKEQVAAWGMNAGTPERLRRMPPFSPFFHSAAVWPNLSPSV